MVRTVTVRYDKGPYDKGRLIQVLSKLSNTTTGHISRIVEIIQSRSPFRSLLGHPAKRVHARKVISGQNNLVMLY